MNIFISGSTTGIGLAAAKRLGKAGNKVAINGSSQEKLQAAENELKSAGVEVDSYLANFTDENEVQQAIEAFGNKHGKIDTLINAVGGLGGRSPIETMETEFFRKVMALNLDSAFYASRAAIPFLKKGENASIINFTSIAAYNAGGPGAGIYGTSKAAILCFTRALAKELAPANIRANAVSPGTIDTPFHSATDPKIMEGWKGGILMKRFGTPDETADLIAFLASKEAGYITGEVIQINGGQAFI